MLQKGDGRMYHQKDLCEVCFLKERCITVINDNFYPNFYFEQDFDIVKGKKVNIVKEISKEMLNCNEIKKILLSDFPYIHVDVQTEEGLHGVSLNEDGFYFYILGTAVKKPNLCKMIMEFYKREGIRRTCENCGGEMTLTKCFNFYETRIGFQYKCLSCYKVVHFWKDLNELKTTDNYESYRSH